MEYALSQSKLGRLSARFNLVVLLCVGLLMANILLAILSLYALNHQKTRYIPTVINEPFVMSGSQVGANYLDMMSEALTSLLYDTTARTVRGNHRQVLNLIAPESTAHFSKMLARDAHNIQAADVASTFYLTQIQSNPQALTTEVTGTLHRSVGERVLPTLQKHFVIHYRYRGRLQVVSIIDKAEEKTEKAEKAEKIARNKQGNKRNKNQIQAGGRR